MVRRSQQYSVIVLLSLLAIVAVRFLLHPTTQSRLGLSTFHFTSGHSHNYSDMGTCPFCNIADAYGPSPSYIPENPSPELIDPNCHLILSTPSVLAFLDILPITQGHVLVVPRQHREKLKDLKGHQGAALGAWLPVVSKATMRALGRAEGDWNVVQNNGRQCG